VTPARHLVELTGVLYAPGSRWRCARHGRRRPPVGHRAHWKFMIRGLSPLVSIFCALMKNFSVDVRSTHSPGRTRRASWTTRSAWNDPND